MKRLYKILDELFVERGIILKKLSKAVKELSDYFKAEVLLEGDYMSKEWALFAYLFYFYPLNVYKFLTIFNYHSEHFQNKRGFFDFGAGPLTSFTAVALSSLKPARLYAVDKSRYAMEMGKTIIDRLDKGLSQKITISKDLKSANFQDYDVFIFGNVLVEMAEEDRNALLERLLIADEGKERLILILEPGTKKSFYRLQEIERSLSERGYQKLNPCPTNYCPIRKGDWCHENVKMPRSQLMMQIENQTGLDNKFVNFCYLLMGSKKDRQEDNGKNYYRVVSNLIEKKGYYMVHLCSPKGIEVFELQKRDLSDSNKDFSLLRRGDIVLIEDVVKKGERLRLNKASVVKVLKRFSREKEEG